MSEVKLDANGLVTPSISLGNNILSSEDNKLLWNGEEFKSSGGGGHNVGEQWISMDGTIPLGGIPFNGQVLNIADYQALYNWAKDNSRIKTESEWQTLKTNNNSNVAYYSDYSSTQFRMPLFRGYLKADSGSGYIKQGLPNITGTINEAYGGYGVWGGSGAFSIVNGSNVSTRGGGGGNVSDKDVTFNASLSNAIYGRSSNVTPETSKMLVGVYAFSTVVNGTILDATNEITSNIKFSISNTHYDIGFPYGDSSGPILSLRSVNYSNNPGGFELSAIDASNQKTLRGTTGGSLTWDGKQIIRLVESAKSGTNWYRKYSDGFIEQGGIHNISAQGSWDLPTITFLKPFSNTNYSISVSGISYNGSYHAIGCLQSKTTTSFKHYFYNNVNINPSWYACGY